MLKILSNIEICRRFAKNISQVIKTANVKMDLDTKPYPQQKTNMEEHFEKVRGYLMDLDYNIVAQAEAEGILMIEKEDEGINNMVIGCSPPILIMEQQLVELKNPTAQVFESLLKKNRDIIHGALVLDETGTKIIFRDTLQIENLDLNELEGSINSLSLLLSEYSNELISFSK